MIVRMLGAAVVAQLLVAEHGLVGRELVDGVFGESAREHVGIAELEADVRAREHVLDRFAIRKALIRRSAGRAHVLRLAAAENGGDRGDSPRGQKKSHRDTPRRAWRHGQGRPPPAASVAMTTLGAREQPVTPNASARRRGGSWRGALARGGVLVLGGLRSCGLLSQGLALGSPDALPATRLASPEVYT